MKSYLEYKLNHLDKLELEYRVRKLEQKILESKNIGLLYHVCSCDAFIDYILPNDTLQASGKYNNWLYAGNDYVSFTRDKNFVIDSNATFSADILLQLVIDGNKLSNNYKIRPYNDFAYDYHGNKINDKDAFKQSEKEEVVKGPIKNISKYIKEIYFDFKYLDNGTIKQLKILKQYNDQLFKYKHIFKNNNIDLPLKTGDDLDYAINILDDYIKSKNNIKLLFSGKPENIKQAIDNGVDPNTKDKFGNIALCYYCTDKDKEFLGIAKQLLDNGADPNFIDNRGTPLLSRAANNINYNMVKLLVNYGANIFAKDKKGWTALMHAICIGDDDTVKYLVSKGADINDTANDGTTCMQLAEPYDYMIDLLSKL